jgi:hypothetical protein
VVDPQVAWHVTEWGLDGGNDPVRSGAYKGEIDWAEQEGRWYPRKGEINETTRNKKYYRWSIDEISFDATKLRPKFAISDKELPLGTKVSTFGEINKQNLRSATEVHYVGGDAGAKEHRLRAGAIINADLINFERSNAK